MFNDIFIHLGEVWAKVKYPCKLPLVGFVKPDIPIRMSVENFKKLVEMGHPVVKLTNNELMFAPLGKFHEPAPLAHQKLEIEKEVVEEAKNEVKEEVVVVEPIEEVKPEPVIENTIPDGCVLEMSSVGDMLEQQIAEDKDIEEEQEDEAITRTDINKMKKADLQKLLDFLEVPYEEGMLVKELRALAIEELNL